MVEPWLPDTFVNEFVWTDDPDWFSIITSVKLVVSEKALSPILVTEEGIIRVLANPEQRVNALLLIVVTEFGIVREPITPEQIPKQGGTILIIPCQTKRYQYSYLPFYIWF